MLIFLDTEFTGLGQPWPGLISIGLISDDGLHSFYAELAAENYIEKVTPWVRANVLPLLEGGDYIMQPDELRQRLVMWINSLDVAQIASDSGIDFDFLRSILDPWPPTIASKPFFIAGGEFAEAVGRIYKNSGLRQHHALDDAKAIRLGWLSTADSRKVQ